MSSAAAATNSSPSSSSSSAPPPSVTGGGGGGVIPGIPANVDLGSDYFAVGSLVSCKTCSDVQVKGTVLAFDPKTRILILKLTAASGKPSTHDVHMLNLNMCRDVRVLSENKDSPPPQAPPLPDISTDKLQNRLRDQVERKKRLVMAYKAGISPAGQSLFRAISKTMDEVVWDGDNILVMDRVTISPPYRPENVKGEKQALKHIRKIVEKHINDEAAANGGNVSGDTSSGGNSISSSNNSSKEATPASQASTTSSSSSAAAGGGGGGAVTLAATTTTTASSTTAATNAHPSSSSASSSSMTSSSSSNRNSGNRNFVSGGGGGGSASSSSSSSASRNTTRDPKPMYNNQ